MLDDHCEIGELGGGDLAPSQRNTSPSYLNDEIGTKNRRRAIAGLALTLSALTLCLKTSLSSSASTGGNSNALLELSAKSNEMHGKEFMRLLLLCL